MWLCLSSHSCDVAWLCEIMYQSLMKRLQSMAGNYKKRPSCDFHLTMKTVWKFKHNIWIFEWNEFPQCTRKPKLHTCLSVCEWMCTGCNALFAQIFQVTCKYYIFTLRFCTIHALVVSYISKQVKFCRSMNGYAHTCEPMTFFKPDHLDRDLLLSTHRKVNCASSYQNISIHTCSCIKSFACNLCVFFFHRNLNKFCMWNHEICE